jgi:hypothetical protein
MSWLKKRAEEDARAVVPSSSGMNSLEAMNLELSIAIAIESVAREFAERALRVEIEALNRGIKRPYATQADADRADANTIRECIIFAEKDDPSTLP